MKNKILLFVVLMIYILLPIVILFNNYLFEIKFYLLTIISALIFTLFKIFKVSNKELGISKDNLLKSIKRNLILILVSIIIIIVFKIMNMDKYNPNETLLFYIFYILISCPAQEFLYRGVFGYFDMNSKYNYIWIILSSLCYSFVHIIYKDLLTCVLTFIIGIIWYILYNKDKNLCGVTLSHMVLGVATLFLGIIN